jgi:hypothetical protein
MFLPDAPLGVTAPMLQGGIVLKAPFEVELCSSPAVIHARSIREYIVRTILLIILVLLLIGALPTWPYSSGWGYYPSGGLGLVLIILLIMVLMGRV